MSSDPHKPLRDDVRLLGELLGEALRAREGERRFDLVERVRALAKSARAGDRENFERLASVLGAMPVDDVLAIARAFSQFLNLANIAEQHHRIRRRRAYQQTADRPPQRGSCDETFGRLIETGIAPDRLGGAVTSLSVELVLTAHPTEIVRRTLLQKYDRIARSLAEKDRSDLTVIEREAVVDDLRREIAASWETDEIRRMRPTPLDEVRGGLLVFEQTLWEALPRYLRELDRALRRHTGARLPLDVSPIRFGTWIGGDRDGNPHVTPEVTRQACLLGRWIAADLFFREVDLLRGELSLSEGSAELQGARGRIARAVSPAASRRARAADRDEALGRKDARGAARRGHRPGHGQRKPSRLSRCRGSARAARSSAIARCARRVMPSSLTGGCRTCCGGSRRSA